jgi:CRISPR-associated endonuclease Cas1/CRISPR-associated protein Cas4
MAETLEGDAAGGEEAELLPARMLNEFVYCPRLFHLEWVQKEWADNADTVAGKFEHRRVDVPSGELPPAAELVGQAGEVRSVQLSSPSAGIVAKLDLLELRDGRVVPVDYKKGRAPEVEGGIWDADRVQVGAQALVLIENGYRCEEAIVYYAGSRRRVSLAVDATLLDEVREVARKARAASEDPKPPPPLRDSPKCPRCSLVGICLPDETLEIAAAEPAEVRLLYPARDDALPLHVQAQGARIGKSGDQIEIVERDGTTHTTRLLDISQVCVFGNVQVSAAALGELLRRGVPVCHFSYGGWFQGITQSLGARNCQARLHQYDRARDPQGCLELARGFVDRKIRNCRTLLRRNAQELPQETLDTLERLAASTARAESLASLLGVEGSAARTYFGAFASMLKAPELDGEAFDFTARNRRPPKDPVNALLSLAYSVLSRDWTVALQSVGLDPFLGLYHRPRFGRAALALDLMEEFRPIVADSVVLQVINNGEVHPDDFVRRGPAVALTEQGRKQFFLAYERRMSHLVTHPRFGYQVSYRRLIEVQARLFARHLAGELPVYEGFRTR